MSPILWLDLETYSPTSIQSGTYAYAEHAEIILWAYAIDDAPAVVWDPTGGAPMPDDLRRALASDEYVVAAHNALFDRTILTTHNIVIPISRWRCIMSEALSHGLPGGLDELCKIFNAPEPQRKSASGKRLIKLFCTPHGRSRVWPHNYPKEWNEFCEYARLDVEAMRWVARKIPKFNDESRLYYLDQKINDTGYCIDMDAVTKMLRLLTVAERRLAARTRAYTAVVGAPTQRDALLRFLREQYGLMIEDLREHTLEALLDDDLPAEVRELVQMRLAASRTSAAKYETLAKSVSSDNRLRGTLRFCGARTGRWSGKIFQPQNLPRPRRSWEEIEAGMELLKHNSLDLLTEEVHDFSRDALRSLIAAPPGKKLIVADYSNIEGRVVAWLAGERWKIDAFRAFDEGRGPDPYKLAYSKAFGVPVDAVGKTERQVGKVLELALGYEGGAGAFSTFAQAYGLNLERLADLVEIPDDYIREAEKLYEEMRPQSGGLSQQVWVVCDAIKRTWRAAHPRIVQFWRNLKDAYIAVVEGDELLERVGHVIFRRRGNWLTITLPSGRNLCYPAPSVDGGKLSYLGQAQVSRQWRRLQTYGGKLSENITQAVARDLLAHAMLALDAAGHTIVLTVHDEIVIEAPPETQVDDVIEIMTTPPPWAKGLPVDASGF